MRMTAVDLQTGSTLEIWDSPLDARLPSDALVRIRLRNAGIGRFLSSFISRLFEFLHNGLRKELLHCLVIRPFGRRFPSPTQGSLLVDMNLADLGGSSETL